MPFTSFFKYYLFCTLLFVVIVIVVVVLGKVQECVNSNLHCNAV